MVDVDFQELDGALGNNVYGGTLGTWFDHGGARDDDCGAAFTELREWRAARRASAGGSAYYVITGFDGSAETVAQTSSGGDPSDPAQNTRPP